MKKILLLTAFVFLSAFAFSQTVIVQVSPEQHDQNVKDYHLITNAINQLRNVGNSVYQNNRDANNGHKKQFQNRLKDAEAALVAYRQDLENQDGQIHHEELIIKVW